MENHEDFRQTFPGILERFPSNPPDDVVPEGGDGDYGRAQEMFAIHGSDWDCESIFENRGLINFLNDEAFRFFLPRMICCTYSKKEIDPDILDYVIFGLRDHIHRFSELFLPEQCSVLISSLKSLLGHVCDEYPDPGFEETEVELQRILDALGADTVL